MVLISENDEQTYILFLSPAAPVIRFHSLIHPTMATCLYAYLLPLVGPALAWLYVVTVHIFLAGFGEIDWISNTSALLLRTALMGASVAISAGLCESGNGDMWATIAPVSTVLLVISAYFIVQTRRDDVAGPKPMTTPNMLEGKVVLVTGANTGIGKQTVRQLAALGATVVLGCRNKSKAEAAMQDIAQAMKKESGTTLKANQLRFLQVDLASFISIRAAAKTFIEDFKLPLHILINNAGVMFSKKTMTADGFEMCLQANHLGHFLLTNLLLPKLLANDDPRILNLSSITYKMADSFNFDDVNCQDHPYTLFGQYAQSKVANLLFTKELAKRYEDKGMTVYAVNPGIVRTDVTRNMSFLMKYGDKAFGLVMRQYQKTPPQGAYTSIFGATVSNGDKPPNGSFLSNSREEETNEYINKNPEDATRLWDLSEKLVVLSPAKK
jgi:NAD(P)-dependent dehydrogenase (short-subunit alcohol dehydrogenase family)